MFVVECVTLRAFFILKCSCAWTRVCTVVVHVLNLCHGKCTFVFVRYVCTVHITHLCWHLRYLRCIFYLLGAGSLPSHFNEGLASQLVSCSPHEVS